MSRLTDPSAESDPLQRSHAGALAANLSQPMLSGLVSVAPRLAVTIAFAGLVQMTFGLISR